MSDHDDLAAIERAGRDLVPELTQRLNEQGLGEIEVRHDDVRVRVAAAPAAAAPAPTASATHAQPTGGSQPVGPGAPAPASGPRRHPVGAPAVGHFVYADGLGPGQEVAKGDALGWVEMLGVRHDVRAPRAGTVRGLPAESGEAVEYGQPLVEIEDRAS
ncbi:MAG TPA: biotin/lipoyl-containing protein [Candidatus Limnocylindria bacterium]|nr:biotin/lipoyl-containing protein [Candidatus Limnocylindria bacterium]